MKLMACYLIFFHVDRNLLDVYVYMIIFDTIPTFEFNNYLFNWNKINWKKIMSVFYLLIQLPKPKTFNGFNEYSLKDVWII